MGLITEKLNGASLENQVDLRAGKYGFTRIRIILGKLKSPNIYHLFLFLSSCNLCMSVIRCVDKNRLVLVITNIYVYRMKYK